MPIRNLEEIRKDLQLPTADEAEKSFTTYKNYILLDEVLSSVRAVALRHLASQGEELTTLGHLMQHASNNSELRQPLSHLMQHASNNSELRQPLSQWQM